MHGLYIGGSDTVLCHTGTSPNSPTHARILTVLWNRFVEEAAIANTPTEERPMFDTLRNWMMSQIAGRRFAYWIKDEAQQGIDDLGVMGGGAAICLVAEFKKINATTATYTLDGYKITVEQTSI